MPLIITPGQLTQRAELYHQLGQLTAVGVTLPQALEHLRRNPPARSLREPLQRLINQLAQGHTFTEALSRSGKWMSSFDLALLQAGEHSGRLDAVFKLLANFYNDRARLTRQVIADLAYPAFLLHAAIFIFPFVQFFVSGDWLSYLRQTLGVLLPIYGAAFFLVFASQGRRGETWRAGMETVCNRIPILGKARRELALARLAAALEALISAGVTIIEAWELAAAASGSPALRRAVLGWKPRVLAGQTPAEEVSASPQFPELFANHYHTGEISGQLDETLRRLQTYYQEEGTRKLHALAQWSPRIVYLAVALMIAYRVIKFYTGYFQQVQNLGGF
ncbi:MAG: type II secretion system F family protein [Verrucomicrobia bacterium]|nr:type II secretion system F family protein [Verrucomicrobiota bacterium]